MSPISATHDQRGELPDPGQRPEHLDSRVGLGVRRAARRRSGRSAAPGRSITARQSVTISRDAERQVQSGQPAPARPGPASWRTGHGRGRRRPRGSGCAAGCRGRTRPIRVPQQRPEPPDASPGRSTPRAAGPRAAAAPGSPRLPSFFSRAEAIALHRSGCTMPCASKPEVLAADRPAELAAERGLERHRRPRAGRSPISRSNGSEPFTTFLFSCTCALGPRRLPPPGTRLRCTSTAHVDLTSPGLLSRSSEPPPGASRYRA